MNELLLLTLFLSQSLLNMAFLFKIRKIERSVK